MFSTIEDTLQFLALSSKRYLHPNRRKDLYQELLVHKDLRKDSLDYFPLPEETNELIISTIYQKTETQVIQQFSDSYEEADEHSVTTDEKEQSSVEEPVGPDTGKQRCIQLFTSPQLKSKNVFRSKSLNQERNINLYFLYTARYQDSSIRKTNKITQRICSAEDIRFCDEKTHNFDRLQDYLNMENRRKKKLKYTFLDDDSINGDTSEFDTLNGREECLDQDLSRVRITGRLGITNDDKYIVQCKAVVNDSEVPVNCGTNELYSSDWNYKSDKSNQTHYTRSKTEELRPSYHEYAHRYSDISDYSKHLNNGLSKPKTFQVSENPLVIISVYSPQPMREDSANQSCIQTQNSIFSDKTRNSNYNDSRQNSCITRDVNPNIRNAVKCCRCCCPSRKYRSYSLSNDRKRSIEIMTNNEDLKQNTGSIDIVSLDNRISPSLTNRVSSSFQQRNNNEKTCPCPQTQSLNIPKPKRSTSPRKSPKNKIGKKVSSKEIFKSTKVVQRVNAETSPLRKRIKNKSPARNASPSRKEKNQKVKDHGKKGVTQDLSSHRLKKTRSKSSKRNASPKNTKGTKENKTVKESIKTDKQESNIHVNIEGMCENYDVSFRQGPDVANVLILKQIKNGISNIKNKCLNGRSRGCHFQNQYPTMMDRTCVTSEYLPNPLTMPKSKACTPRNCPARKLMENSAQQNRRKFEPELYKQDNLHIAPRCSDGYSKEGKKKEHSHERNECKILQDGKHYTGDGCDVIDPVERDRQIRKLLGVGTPKSGTSTEYQAPPPPCSMDCIFRQCNSPKSSYSYTNAITVKPLNLKPIPVQILTERGTGSSIIHINEDTEEESSSESTESDYSSENEEISVDIADTSLYKQLVLERNIIDELFEIKPCEIIKHQLSSISIGEVRKIVKQQKSNHTASKEIQVEPSEHFRSLSGSSEINVPIKFMLDRSLLCPSYKSSPTWNHSCLESTIQTSIISQIPKYDCRSVQTIYKAKENSITPNLGASAVCLMQEDDTYYGKAICSVSTQIEQQPKTKKLFKRLIPCFMCHNVRSSAVRVGNNTNRSFDNNTMNSYSISTSPIIEMSSSMFDTSVSYYSNHSIHNNTIGYKSSRGFFSSVKDFLSSKKTCDRGGS